MRALVVTLITIAACNSAGQPTVSVPVISRIHSGDTVFVRIEASNYLPDRHFTLDSVEIIWTPPEWRRIQYLFPTGSELVASDGRVVVVVDPVTGVVRNIGRNGEGPGEYRSVTALSVASGDSLIIADAQVMRRTTFALDGSVLGMQPLVGPDSQSASIRALAALVSPKGSTVEVWERGLVDPSGGEDSVSVFSVYADGSSQRRFRVADGAYIIVGDGMLAKRDAYGSVALTSVSGEDGVAVTDGVRYFIEWWRPGPSPQVMWIVRDWSRRSTALTREPTEEQKAQLGERSTVFAAIVARQEQGPERNSIERLVLIGEGMLMARVVDTSHVYHPLYYNRLPDLRPKHWLWEVFSDNGELLAQLSIPTTFEPIRFQDCTLLGVYADADGVHSVGRLALGEACALLAPA